MTKNKRRILEVVKKAIPMMSDAQRGHVLGYSQAIIDLRDDMEMKIKEVMEEKKKLVEANAPYKL